MKSRDVEKFFDDNREEMNTAHKKRRGKLAIAALMIFPVFIASFICCLVGGTNAPKLAVAIYTISVMAFVGFCFFIKGYNAAQQDNMDSLDTFVSKWNEFKKTTKKKKEDK